MLVSSGTAKTPERGTQLSAFASFLAARFGCSGVLEIGETTEDLAPEALQDAIIYCALARESAGGPTQPIGRLKRALRDAPGGLVVAPGMSEASTRALRELLERAGLNVDFVGTVPDASTSERIVVAVLA
jgi:hypothetical protein